MTPPPQAHAELREKATRLIAAEEAGLDANGEIPREMDDADEAFDEIDPPRTVVALLDRIAALEAQVALSKQVIGAVIQAFGIKDTSEHKTAVAKLKESLEAIDKLAPTRYPQGAARVK